MLTRKQKAVFEFLRIYINENRRSPLIREIQFGCEIVSYKSAVDRLNAIERKGFIKRVPNKHRGIKITKDFNVEASQDIQISAVAPVATMEDAG